MPVQVLPVESVHQSLNVRVDIFDSFVNLKCRPKTCVTTLLTESAIFTHQKRVLAAFVAHRVDVAEVQGHEVRDHSFGPIEPAKGDVNAFVIW